MTSTNISVLIAHAKNEESQAEEIGKRLTHHGITVAHRGTLFAGDSFIAEASAALHAGYPVVLCGTVQAAGTRWGKRLVRSASETGNAIYPILMEEEADFSGLLLADTKFSSYFLNPDRAMGELVQILKQRHRRSSQIITMDEQSELAAYRSWALKKHGNVALIGVGGADLTMDLAKVYIPLRISQRSLLADMERRKIRPSEASAQQNDGDVELTKIFATGKKRHVALFGDPGAGKSTAMRKLLHHCLVDGPAVLGLEEKTLPLFLRLRRFDEKFLTKPLSFFLQSELDVDSGQSLPVGLGERLWDRGGLLLLFDGLDEIANQKLRAKVVRMLENAVLDGPSREIYAVISCRYAGYGDKVWLGGSFLHLDVRPLDNQQVDDFVRLWFQEAHRCLPKGNPLQAEQEASKLLGNLQQNRHANQQIKVLVGNPLLLTLLCVVVLQKHEIPRRRVEFYRHCLEVLLYRWRYLQEVEEPPLSLEMALSVLRRMAWEMHTQGRQYDMTKQEFITLATAVLDQQGASGSLPDGGLGWFHLTCGVLEEYSPKCYGFMHLGFQEYLAASHVAAQRQTLVTELVAHSGEKWWKEVILLLAGLEDADLFVRLVEAILPNICQAEGAALLREVLAEAPVVDLAPFEKPLVNGNREAQVALLRLLLGRNNTPLRNIAEQLAKKRDNEELQTLAHRFLDRPAPAATVVPPAASDGVTPSPTILIEPRTGLRLLPVPGGIFTMGSDDGHGDERPPHPVQLSPYWLAETPVTNRHYGLYLQATQAREPKYWRDRRFSDPEQPVVGVDWNDAVAFCVWLTEGIGQGHICTLPSEAQWEFAARGLDGRPYPWGKEKPTKKRACFDLDDASGKPAPVGSFPAGRGPFGHLDLAGNVWEWCRDGWSGEDYKQWIGKTPMDPVVTKGDSRVLRGGSWLHLAGDLRSAYRIRNPAVNRNADLGFRVSAAPSST